MIDKSKISRERLLYLKKKRNSKIFVIFMRVFILCAFFFYGKYSPGRAL